MRHLWAASSLHSRCQHTCRTMRWGLPAEIKNTGTSGWERVPLVSHAFQKQTSSWGFRRSMPLSYVFVEAHAFLQRLAALTSHDLWQGILLRTSFAPAFLTLVPIPPPSPLSCPLAPESMRREKGPNQQTTEGQLCHCCTVLALPQGSCFACSVASLGQSQNHYLPGRPSLQRACLADLRLAEGTADRS